METERRTISRSVGRLIGDELFMFGIVKIHEWDQARFLSRKMIRWGFRGHQRADWTMMPSIERLYAHFGNGQESLPGREFWILRQFQRRAHKYVPNLPSLDNNLEWLALIQHYGGPTRLLDFTHSFYIAAFFAVETSANDSAIWAINLPEIEQRHGEIAGHETIDHVNQRHIIAVERTIKEGSDECRVLNVEPDRLNERMSIQQGMFIMPFNLEKSFIENLTGTFGVPQDTLEDSSAVQIDIEKACNEYWNLPPIVKIVLPHSIHGEVINDLREMNVTSASLFPDFDGFARSLIQHLRI